MANNTNSTQKLKSRSNSTQKLKSRSNSTQHTPQFQFPVNITQPECKSDSCNSNGECTVYNQGEIIAMLECTCDLLHTGQNCQLFVRPPYVAIVASLLVPLAIIFFWFYSRNRFRAKKVYTAEERYRFVDYVHQSQLEEKRILRQRFEENRRKRGINRRTTSSDKEKTQKKKRQTPNPEKQSSVSPAAPSVGSLMTMKMKLKQLEAKEAVLDNGAKTGAAGKATLGGSSMIQVRTLTNPVQLVHARSDQLVPQDAPSDLLVMMKKERNDARKIEADAEQQMKETEKGKKKKK
ncbi:unnamed protein product [Caenorhabditis sp. 36 PRJEB53466]|nr:unnamed protein product [Caenorhabditis sp. 36 PRJEB53466]